MKRLTIVVPVFNEEDNLEFFTDSIYETMAGLPDYEWRLLFVNDGSRDSSPELLAKLAKEHQEVGYISLSRNYGHQAALTCGLDHAEGDAVITMDGDMQHPPALIPELLRLWEEGYDVVQTIRLSTEGVSEAKKLTSRLYYKMLNYISETTVRPGGSDFRLMSRKAVDALRQYHEHARFLRGMVSALGFRQTTLEFTAPPRHAGESKFSLRKMAHLAMDGILSYSVVPLRLAFYIGLISSLFSLILFLHVLFEYLQGDTVPGWSTLMCVISFFCGMQMMTLGIVGEYIGRIFAEVKHRPIYLIAEEHR